MTQFTPDNYLTINGRLRRKDYWLLRIPPVLLHAIALGLTGAGILPSAIFVIIALIVLVIFFMLDIRRFHDRDKSGWWLLILLIPLVGAIWMLVELGFLKGTAGPNRFGPDPLASI